MLLHYIVPCLVKPSETTHLESYLEKTPRSVGRVDVLEQMADEGALGAQKQEGGTRARYLREASSERLYPVVGQFFSKTVLPECVQAPGFSTESSSSCHCQLNFTVRWKYIRGAPPTTGPGGEPVNNSSQNPPHRSVLYVSCT